MKKFKYFLLLILLIPFIKINALELCNGVTLPDYSFNSSYSYVIAQEGNDTYLYELSAPVIYVYIDNTNKLRITVEGSNSMISRYVNWSGWVSYGSSSAGYSVDLSNSSNYVLATTVDIIILSDNSVVYSSGYNFDCSSPTPDTPDIPQDFSIINYIASHFNDFVVYLQENNISIHITFLSLLIFNFLVFVICYIVTHLE